MLSDGSTVLPSSALPGNADAAVEVASFAGAVHPDYAAAFSNASQLDGWFTADGRALDASRVPTARVSGSIAGGVLSAGPGRAALPMRFTGGVGLLEMVSARMSFSAVGLSAPTVSVGGSPPGHLVSEHLQNGLQSFSGVGAGEVCGGILARSLAEIPLDSTFVTFCNVQGYTAANSFLDMLVGGCRYSTLVISTATQPDLWDPAATVLGAGGPYHLVADPGSKAVTGCTDKDGGAVSLAACLDAAAFSSIFQFAAVGAVPQDLKYRGEAINNAKDEVPWLHSSWNIRNWLLRRMMRRTREGLPLIWPSTFSISSLETGALGRNAASRWM